jgi:hypothetical protein
MRRIMRIVGLLETLGANSVESAEEISIWGLRTSGVCWEFLGEPKLELLLLHEQVIHCWEGVAGVRGHGIHNRLHIQPHLLQALVDFLPGLLDLIRVGFLFGDTVRRDQKTPLMLTDLSNGQAFLWIGF